MWSDESVFYQIYPLGFCGAPFENDGVLTHRIEKVYEWIPHMKKLGINAIYFSPIFESDTHGYNARDYRMIDKRLGTNEDFAKLCKTLHENGIRIVLDGVFNHAGRGFFAFRDVQEHREQSGYCSWFYLNFQGNSSYNDGFWYEGWEGNYDLVKLNLRNEDVIRYLLDSVGQWIDEFDIDGLRLDVAYCLDRDFIRRLRSYTDSKKQDFFLVGEMLHGDYNQIMNDAMLHSVTNYECYKGLFSSFNSNNLFEIMHSLMRQFGPEQWTLYKGKHLLNFVDNHDVTRVSSILTKQEYVKLIYTVLFSMPGIPCVYYGSEWGAKGEKSAGDPALRPCFDAPCENELTEWIGKLAAYKKQSMALNHGSLRSIYLNNKSCVFERWYGDERTLTVINMEENPITIRANLVGNMNVVSTPVMADSVMTGEAVELGNELTVPAYHADILRCRM